VSSTNAEPGTVPAGSEAAVSGTQSLDRGIEIMRALARAGSRGLRLTDLQQEVGLTRPTTHRLVSALIRNQFVEQEETTRRYRLAHQLITFGWSMLAWEGDLRELCARDLATLARDVGDSAHLVARSGYESVCLDRCVGTYPIKVLTVDVGARRPLGVGASGIALLSALSPADVDSVLKVIEPQLELFPPLTVGEIARRVAEARRNGFASSDGYRDQRLRGLAVPLRTELGGLVGALSVAAVVDRIPDERVPEVVAQLMRRRDAIEALIASTRPETRRPAGPPGPGRQP
jgi:DNA-binding IclR family transcriptional regulator